MNIKKGETVYFVNRDGEIKEVIANEDMAGSNIYVQFKGGRILSVSSIRVFRTMKAAQRASEYYSHLGILK
jgi:hypothetical protein